MKNPTLSLILETLFGNPFFSPACFSRVSRLANPQRARTPNTIKRYRLLASNYDYYSIDRYTWRGSR